MNLQRIEEHTFDLDLLKNPMIPWVLDVGCRGFGMAKQLVSMGCNVVAMDPDPDIEDLGNNFSVETPKLIFLRQALVSREEAFHGSGVLMRPHDVAGSYVYSSCSTSNPTTTPTARPPVDVELVDIVDLTHRWLNINTRWSAVKLDCEDSEYGILLDWPGPIADQISVEFHEHLANFRFNLSEYYPKMLKHLGQWYASVKFDRTHQHGLGENYWDTLFVLKELVS